MKIKVGSGNKKINLEVKKLSYFSNYTGLMFKSRNSENLLFDLPGTWGIHSLFVFFPFLALWLDERNNILEQRIVRPFTFLVKPRLKFAKLVEIPVNEENRQIISVLSSIKRKV